MKTCSKCGHAKPVSEFNRCRKHADGRAYWCRACCKTYQAAHYARHRPRRLAQVAAYQAANCVAVRERQAAFRHHHRQRLRAWHRQHRADNPDLMALRWRKKAALRRTRQRACRTAPFSDQQLADKFAYWNDCCWVCGDPAAAVDHVKPLAAGGAHMLCNLRPICGPCNSAKRDKWPVPSRAVIIGAAA